MAVEAGVGLGWERWVGDQGQVVSIERYGASAPYKTIFEHLGFTPDHILGVVALDAGRSAAIKVMRCV